MTINLILSFSCSYIVGQAYDIKLVCDIRPLDCLTITINYGKKNLEDIKYHLFIF